MAGTVGDQQYLCPLWKGAYPPDSPCAHTDDLYVGENDPAINEAERERLRPKALITGLPWVVWVGLGLVVVYLGIRGSETFVRLRESWYRVPGER